MLSVDYGSAEYWSHRYSNSNPAQEPFEWYESYQSLKYIFDHFIGSRDNEILNVGCGNSIVPFEMHKDGYKNMLNIDISDVLIKQMETAYPTLKWKDMDVTSLAFPDSSYDVVLDKGTLDALLCGGRLKAEKMLSEISRVLKPGGVFLVVTYGPPTIRLLHLCKPEYNWSVMVQIVGEKLGFPGVHNINNDEKSEEKGKTKTTTTTTTTTTISVESVDKGKEKEKENDSSLENTNEESEKGDCDELKDVNGEDVNCEQFDNLSIEIEEDSWSDTLFSSDNHYCYVMTKKG